MAEKSAARRLRILALLIAGALLSACASWPVEDAAPEPARVPSGQGEVPQLPPAAPPPPERSPAPLPPARPALPEPQPAPSYHPAGEALVEQARREMLLGDAALAGATLERALRIDGDNPWIWIELGHLRLEAGERAAAESMARKALSLAGRDAVARGAADELLRQAGR